MPNDPSKSGVLAKINQSYESGVVRYTYYDLALDTAPAHLYLNCVLRLRRALDFGCDERSR